MFKNKEKELNNTKRTSLPFFFAAIFFAVLFGVVILTKFIFAWSNPIDAPGTGEGILHSSGGNVGIGVSLPGQKLSVNGVIESTAGGFKFPDGSIQTVTSPPGGRQVYASATSTTFTVPSGVTKIWATGFAGGGGGGGIRYNYQDGTYAGNGGKGASIYLKELTVVSGQTYNVTVGSGGAKGVDSTGAASVTAGTAGGNTTFGSLLVLNGGGGGAARTTSGTGASGADGTGGDPTSFLYVVDNKGTAGARGSYYCTNSDSDGCYSYGFFPGTAGGNGYLILEW